jgi:hypothetical protein
MIFFSITYRTLKRIVFRLIFFFLSVNILFSQDESSNDSSFYREDQIYLGISFILLESNQKGLNSRGLSSHFQWGVIRDIPISENGRFAFGFGLGMNYERYNTNLFRKEDPSGMGIYSVLNDNSESPLFFSVHSIETPLTFRWRSSSLKDYAFWRVYGGVSLQWNYSIIGKQATISLPISNDLERIGTTAHLSFGYNTWNFYIAYRLSPFFKSESLAFSSLPIEFNPLKIGLIFYFL